MSLVLFVLAGGFMLPRQVSAFWPFDPATPGQVMGATTTTEQGGFMGLVQKVFRPFSVPATVNREYHAPIGATGDWGMGGVGPYGATGAMGGGIMMPDPKARLDEAVKNGKLTQAQEDEILARLAAIRTKQQEIMALEKSLKEWMTANSLTTVMFGAPPREMKGTPPVRKMPPYYPNRSSGATGANGTYRYNQ